LLEARAELLDERRLRGGRLAAVDHARDRERERADRPPLRDGLAEDGAIALALAQPLLDEQVRRQPPLRPRALEGQLGGVLRPAAADLAEHELVGHEDAVERDLVEELAPVE